MLPIQIGDELERAVHHIEETIVRSFPRLSEEDFDLEPKKIINAEGVRHEIDLYVKYSLPLGYDSVFLFECKNWKKPVDKNQIVVFSEKIKVTNAQRGFFVAKSYSKNAIAQASKDPKIELLSARELDPDIFEIPFGFHVVFVEEKRVKELIFHAAEAEPVSSAEMHASDSLPMTRLDVASLELNGRETALAEYFDGWIDEEVDRNMSTFPSGEMPTGVYTREIHAEKELADEVLKLNGQRVERIAMRLTYDVRVIRPRIRSVLDVEGRGRSIQLERCTVGDSCFDASFVSLNS